MKNILLVVLCGLFFGSLFHLLTGWFFEDAKANNEPLPRLEVVGSKVQLRSAVESGDRLQMADLEFQPVYAPFSPSDNLLLGSDDYETSTLAIFSRDLPAGTVLKKTDILTPDEPGYVSHLIKPGFRAKSLTIANLAQYDGLVHQGDLVDILYTSAGPPASRVSENPTVKTLIRNAQIIGPIPDGNSLAKGPRANPQGTSLLFAISLEDSVRASLAQEVGKLTIVLRNPVKGDDHQPGKGTHPLATLADLVSLAPVTRPLENPGEPQHVRVMRGSSLVTISVPGRTGSGAE